MREKMVPTRRSLIGSTLALSAVALAGSASAEAPDFKTGADIAKAEQEGELVYYSHDGEAGASAVVEGFMKDFPKIKARYVRAQTGALFNKVLSERAAGRFDVDVIQFSEIATAVDFQKRGGYERYVSPQNEFYAPEHLSPTPGDYFWVGVTFAGIGYNTDRVPAAEAPKTWKDLLDPRWRNAMSTKQATSGMQFMEWYMLRKLYGDDYWKEFAKQRPRGFDARAQLFDRLAKGEDKVCALAEYAGYALYKEKNAPIAFVAPPDGLPATPALAGIVNKAPHPEAAKLFIDWHMSPRGQEVQQQNPYLLYGSVRKNAPPMRGGVRLSDFKLLAPTDMNDYLASQPAFAKQWNAMLGL